MNILTKSKYEQIFFLPIASLTEACGAPNPPPPKSLNCLMVVTIMENFQQHDNVLCKGLYTGQKNQDGYYVKEYHFFSNSQLKYTNFQTGKIKSNFFCTIWSIRVIIW